MKIDVSEWVVLGDQDVCSAQHLAEISGLSEDDINDLMDMGVIEPVDHNTQPRYFHLSCVVTVNVARRLRDDFELERNGMVLALTLTQRIEKLEAELNSVRAKALSK